MKQDGFSMNYIEEILKKVHEKGGSGRVVKVSASQPSGYDHDSQMTLVLVGSGKPTRE